MAKEIFRFWFLLYDCADNFTVIIWFCYISISFISHGLDFFHSKRLLVMWKCDKRGKVPQSAPVTPNGDPRPPWCCSRCCSSSQKLGMGGKLLSGMFEVKWAWSGCAQFINFYVFYGGVKRKMEKFHCWETETETEMWEIFWIQRFLHRLKILDRLTRSLSQWKNVTKLIQDMQLYLRSESSNYFVKMVVVFGGGLCRW